ncbi:hypothetical protein ABKN59_008761 [Abortiporus biennis]
MDTARLAEDGGVGERWAEGAQVDDSELAVTMSRDGFLPRRLGKRASGKESGGEAERIVSPSRLTFRPLAGGSAASSR